MPPLMKVAASIGRASRRMIMAALYPLPAWSSRSASGRPCVERTWRSHDGVLPGSRSAAGVFTHFLEGGGERFAQASSRGRRQMADQSGSGPSLLLDGQLDPEIITFLAIVKGSHRPSQAGPFGIIGWMIVKAVIDQLLHRPESISHRPPLAGPQDDTSHFFRQKVPKYGYLLPKKPVRAAAG
jgi:hypothetical protein